MTWRGTAKIWGGALLPLDPALGSPCLTVCGGLLLSSMFLLVIVTAYLEAQGIWEPFKRRLSLEASHTPMETGRPFDLREIVRIQSDTK